MIDIKTHPLWGGSGGRGVNSFKKKGYLIKLFLARNYINFYPRENFIGVSGTVGKSLTVIACKRVLEEAYPTLSTEPGLDSIISIPKTILKIRSKVKKVIFEMGVDYQGEMDFYLSLVKPSIGVITRLGYKLNEFLGSLENGILEYSKLLEVLPKNGFAILNYDDPISRKLSASTQAEVIFYGTDSKNCHVWVDNIKIVNFQTVFELNYGVERIQVKSNLLGKHQIYDLEAAASLGIALGLSLTTIKKGLEKVECLDRRMQALNGYNGSIIIDDTLDNTPLAVEAALETLNQISGRRRILVLAEMRGLGEYKDKLHRQVAQCIYKNKIDLVFLGAGDTSIIFDELNKLGFIPERMETNQQNPQIVSKLLKILSKGDIVLVKGPKSVRLDEVVKRITKK